MRNRPFHLRLVAAGLLASALLPPTDVHASLLLIRNARLIDATGVPPRTGMGILVRDGWIAAIAPNLRMPAYRILDVGGATVLPGLIDAHVHLGVVPGSGQRHDSADVERSLRRQHLRAYLACGVTTVLDTHIDPTIAREIRSWLAAGEAGPRFLTLGPGFVTPRGYLADASQATATLDEVSGRYALLAELGAVGVKVFLERGFGLRQVWPIPSPEARDFIVRMAKVHRLPLYVHAQDEEDMRMALAMGAHAIVHGGFYDAAPSEDFVHRMVESKAYLMTTFSLADAQVIGFHPERLDDPVFRLTVPALELASAREPASERFLARAQVGMAEPLVPGFLRGVVARVMVTDGSMAKRLARSQQAVRRFWAAGVPIVAGSDSGNWPIDPYHFHGPTTLREIQLLGAAGLPPADALASATRIPAEMLALDDEIGTVEVGKRADLVIVRDDPLSDLGALRTIMWTIKNGVAHTPEEWMRQP